MSQVIEIIKAHYDTLEVPFGRSYRWHQAHVVLECDCGEELTLTGASTVPTCRCGADHSAIIQDIQEQEARLRDQVTHPWLYDTQQQAEQHLRDEAAYTEDSPWRYNDVTSGLDDVERWKKA